MPRTGTLRTWHEDRGFGFIAPSDGGSEVFVHISAFPRDGSRPTASERVSFEVGPGKNGKPQAVNVYRSQMTSCAEAKFFLQNCPDTKMDGNNDGVPCEQQFCTSPLAK